MRGVRLMRCVGAVTCTVLGLAAVPTVVAADDFDGDPLEKVAEEIEKLRDSGDWAKSGKLSEQLAACNDTPYEQPFLAWGDSADYVPVPGGHMDDPAGWQLDKDVRLVNAGGDAALLVPEGEEVITAPMCISVNHPTLRFFAANDVGPQLRLEVYVLYEDLHGKLKKLKLAKLRGSDTWEPTKTLRLQVNRLAAASETGLTVVAFKFKTKKVGGKDAEAPDEGYFARQALGSPEEPGWLVDDLYVDPFRAR